MNTQIEIPKVQKRKFNEQYNFSKKKLKTSIESKMIKRANEVKNIHFLTLVLNCFDDPFIFLFVSLVCKLWKQIVETHDFWESFCNQLGINGPNPHAHKYKTYHSIYLKNLNHLYTSCRKDFGERQTSIKKIKFKLDVLNDYCIDHMNFS
ncbi:hypothetical protein C2G38_2204291 [Gigaspora rosea]|uniref:F-box domain-containing protein n=1 Tax=Gigaspora rosea TaxID=44941 RepID=A0A397UPC6_9GLOM|nr:hypothetical protein C2G38_2204291 [Gigaspora rosea]